MKNLFIWMIIHFNKHVLQSTKISKSVGNFKLKPYKIEVIHF